jgi:hypothetical protein
MNKPDRAAALRLPPRRPARLPSGVRQLSRLRAQGDHTECDAPAGAAELYTPRLARKAAAPGSLRKK